MGKFRLLVAAALVAGAVASAPHADAAVARSHQVNQVLRSGRLSSSNAREYSLNWSGYVVPTQGGERITEVAGSWNVPLVRAAPPGWSSAWIGIGGYGTPDLIQVGTASSGLFDQDHAWYEILPEYETPITSGCAGDSSCGVQQGDRLAARIVNVSGDNWVISLTNFGRGASPKWSWSKALTYQSNLASAEYIFEAPQVGVSNPFVGGIQTMPANAPHQKFNGGATVRVSGQLKPLAAAGAKRIVMLTATPSFLAPDGHFTVCAYKINCKNA
jgi:hypothetical protein